MSTDMRNSGSAELPEGNALHSTGVESHRLRGNMGPFKLIVTVLAFNAPLGAFAGLVPLVVIMGGGSGTPLIFAAYGILMALFAVGYLVMANRMPRSGAFYTFVTAGLGRPLGLGIAFAAIVTYAGSLIATLPFGGLSAQALVAGDGGPNIPWWAFVLAMAGGIAVLGVMNVDLSARVISVLVILEVLVVLIYHGFVIATGGQDGQAGLTSLDPTVLWGGGASVAVVFVVGLFAGFESTAIFRDEVRDPKRTIPIATFSVIAILALFYGLGSWLLIDAVGGDDAATVMSNGPATVFIDSLGSYVGPVASDVANVLLVTSVFAALVSVHNISARYLFNLGVDGIVPKALGRPHPKFGSPYIASLSLSAVTIAFFVIVAFANIDPLNLYSKLVGIAGYGMIVSLAVASIAIAAYLIRTSPDDLNSWQKFVAPVSAAVLLLGVVIAVTAKLDLFTGSRSVSLAAVVVVFGCLGIGSVIALALRATRPEAYRRIGSE